LFITNRVTYLAVDTRTRRVIDYVSLDNLTSSLNISNQLNSSKNQFGEPGGFDQSQFWSGVRSGASPYPAGITNQLYVSTNNILSPTEWQSFSYSVDDQTKAIDGFRIFLGMPLLNGDQPSVSVETVKQLPFTPSKKFFLTMSWQANDPLVHYHQQDLYDPEHTKPDNITFANPLSMPVPKDSNIGKFNKRYRPWGGPNGQDAKEMGLALKDPMVRRSDDWNFPTNKYPTIGWLGRVHRGTPWQTLYLKADVADTNIWSKWMGRQRPPARDSAHPTNDWRLMDLFTTAPNDNAARGLLSVNQTNLAAWSAVLSGVATLTNTASNIAVRDGGVRGNRAKMTFAPLQVEPSSLNLDGIVRGIKFKKDQWPNQVFPNMGSILSVPELTTLSPFLHTNSVDQIKYGFTDETYERLPQQILSLLKADEPRLVVYTFGQALKPAGPPYSLPSLVMSGPYAGMCTNYQITGEVWAKAVLRVDGTPQNPKVVVESYNVLPGD
jgi:hypothetical protein